MHCFSCFGLSVNIRGWLNSAVDKVSLCFVGQAMAGVKQFLLMCALSKGVDIMGSYLLPSMRFSLHVFETINKQIFPCAAVLQPMSLL